MLTMSQYPVLTTLKRSKYVCFSLMMSVVSSGASLLATGTQIEANGEPFLGSAIPSYTALIAPALRGAPDWNLSPLRILKVTDRPSCAIVQLDAIWGT